MDKEIIYAMTGEVKKGDNNSILKSGAIGSCIVITTYNKRRNIAVMSHIMLPEEAPRNKINIQKTRYAKNAIDELIFLYELDKTKDDIIEVCLAGGANVLQKTDDNIGQDVIDSVENILNSKKIKVVTRSLGGRQRRSISYNVETGDVYCSIGDDEEKLFWKFNE